MEERWSRGRPLERVQEESYFFRLSAFQDRLLRLYDEHPDFVMPDFRMREVRSFVEGRTRAAADGIRMGRRRDQADIEFVS